MRVVARAAWVGGVLLAAGMGGAVGGEGLEHGRLREAMVREQIEARGVRDPRVLAALRAVPRERFVPAAARDHAYDEIGRAHV